MLGPGRYLQGAVELIWLVGFAWLGAARVRRRLLPEVGGEAGFLATAVVAIALLIWIAELLGTVSLFKPVPYLAAVAILGLVLWRFAPGEREEAPSAGGASAGVPTARRRSRAPWGRPERQDPRPERARPLSPPSSPS